MTNQTIDFYRTFIAEMPYLMGGMNDFEILLMAFRENISEFKPISVTSKIHKLTTGGKVTYWYGDKYAENDEIIVDTFKNGNFQQVTYTAKNTNIPTGNPPIRKRYLYSNTA